MNDKKEDEDLQGSVCPNNVEWTSAHVINTRDSNKARVKNES